jgi:signal transduction histidine kinase
VIDQVNSITVSNLSQRVDEGNQKDEIAQLAITFNQVLQRIEDAFILQHDFVSNAAHELRTPFTVLLTEIDFTLMQERENEYYKKVLFSLSGEIKKLSKLSNGLLDLARISFDKSTFYKKVIRIDELLIEVCNTVLLSNKSFNVKIDFSSLPDNDDQLSFLGSEQLLTIAIKNLIDNACKFSDSKSVEVKLESSEEHITISFSDQGIGIPHEDINNIFQPFYRGKNTQFIAGYGIGLALTQKIIHLHNGEIKVTSKLGKGSTLTVLIPNQHSL